MAGLLLLMLKAI